MNRIDRMELLAPAGNMEALKAAVQNGADAVYLGAGNFNARRNAGNFDEETLGEAVKYCHARGVKVHVTLNTLVREDELEDLAETVRMLNMSGADAVIVQDFGVVRALKQIAPEIELHASTQMAVHNRQGVDFLVKNGFKRVVLAREMTYEEMKACVGRGAEIEVFAHGALCVACSGQCLMSSLVGGRSGNRGLCAQPCRLPWQMDGKGGHLLSTRDLCSLESLDKLRDAGVSSLKIEGRLKRPEYVAVTIAAYRRALDSLYEGKTNVDAAADMEALRQMFNRGGFTKGYGPGVEDRELMFAQRPNHMGVPVGEAAGRGQIKLRTDVENADVLALRRPDAEDVPVKLAGQAGEKLKCAEAKPGDMLYRMVSEAQMRAARESFEGERRSIRISAQASIHVGKPCEMMVTDGMHTAYAQGSVIEAAQNRGADPERIMAQIRKTGGTAYEIADIELNVDENAFCPASVLNALRRDALAELDSMRTAFSRENRNMELPRKMPVVSGNTLYAQSASPEVLNTALASGADYAVYSPADIRREALEKAIEKLPERFFLAVPAVLGSKTLDTLNEWALENRERIEGTFLSNIGQIGLEWPGRRMGDYMLNLASNLSLEQMEDWNMSACTPSVELSTAQISRMGGERNLIMWGRLPLMHLRHCPLRAIEGKKGKHIDCRRCDIESGIRGKALTDRKGVSFHLVRIATEEGCIIQVLNGPRLMPLRKKDRIPESAGWRLLLNENDPVEAVVKVYRAAADGEDVRSMPEWEIIEKLETTTGHYYRGVE
ncbi:MAG: U32 family peptidase [Clostridia bacterium]|nr:U32 family peptidase [Clostridia bacterium]